MSEEQTTDSTDRRRSWVGWAVVLLTLLVIVANLEGLRDLRQARATAAGLESRIEAAGARIERLDAERKQLLHGEATLERLAREELLMVKPGEVVLVLPPKPEEASAADVGPVDSGADGKSSPTESEPIS